jgi:GNAT superfamily N-acetyltransferase
MALDVSLRYAGPTDAAFAYQALERTMREYATKTWGSWPEMEARAETTDDATAGRSQVIQADAARVGLLRFDQSPTHLQLEQLFVLPEYQRQGIGAQVLACVIAQARSLQLPVRLRVLRVNPAKVFYERHGFKVTSESPERFFMERTS